MQIQVGDSVLLTTEGTLAVDLMQHDQENPGFIDGLKMAVKDRELPADAPAVSVFQDGPAAKILLNLQTYSQKYSELLPDSCRILQF